MAGPGGEPVSCWGGRWGGGSWLTHCSLRPRDSHSPPRAPGFRVGFLTRVTVAFTLSRGHSFCGPHDRLQGQGSLAELTCVPGA